MIRAWINTNCKFAAGQWPYLGQCDRLRKNCGEDDWVRMMELKEPVPIEELESMVDTGAVLDDPDETLADFGADDPDSGAYKSSWGDKPCYFFQTSGFEFIWVRQR
jgi:hypothetical protein